MELKTIILAIVETLENDAKKYNKEDALNMELNGYYAGLRMVKDSDDLTIENLSILSGGFNDERNNDRDNYLKSGRNSSMLKVVEYDNGVVNAIGGVIKELDKRLNESLAIINECPLDD